MKYGVKFYIFALIVVLLIISIFFSAYLSIQYLDLKGTLQETYQIKYEQEQELEKITSELININNSIKLSEEKLKEKNYELLEVIKFITATLKTYEEGEFLLEFISNSPDLVTYFPTQRRIQFVEDFLEYQKQFDKNKVEELYISLDIPKEQAVRHFQQVDLYLTVAQKMRDRVNTEEIFKYLNTLDFAMLRSSDGPMKKGITQGLKFAHNYLSEIPEDVFNQ